MNMYKGNHKQRLKINHSLEISDQSSSSSESIRMNQSDRNYSYYEPGYQVYQTNNTIQALNQTAHSCNNIIGNYENLDIHYSNSLPLNLSKHTVSLHNLEPFLSSDINKPNLLDLDEHQQSQNNKMHNKIQSFSAYGHIPQQTTNIMNLGHNYYHIDAPAASTHNGNSNQYYTPYFNDQYPNHQSAIKVSYNEPYYAPTIQYQEQNVTKNDNIYNTFSKSRLNLNSIQKEELLENNAIYNNFAQNALKFVDDDSSPYQEDTFYSKLSGVKFETKNNYTNNSLISNENILQEKSPQTVGDISKNSLNKVNKNDTNNSIIINEEVINEISCAIPENVLNKDNENRLNQSDTISLDKISQIETTPIKSSDNEELLPNSDSKTSDKTETFNIEKISPPFLSMENSNNATDNSSKLCGQFSNSNTGSSNNALNFNGTLKHLTQENKLSFENKIPQLINSKSKNVISLEGSSSIPSTTTSNFCTLKRNESTTSFAPASPSLFSDEDEGSSVDDPESLLGLKESNEVDVENDRLNQNDLELLKRLQKTLGGVLPPPSVTISQLKVGDMLDLYQKNIHLYESKNKNLPVTPSKIKAININDENKQSLTPPNLKSWINIKHHENSPTNHLKLEDTAKNSLDKQKTTTTGNKSIISKSLLISCTMDDVLKTDWPNVMQCRYHGVHYNRGTVSEDFEILCMKYGERYVGAETQSSFTFGISTANQRFNLKSRYTQSPGRRLSHLARRRQTFSSANLQAGTSAGTSQAKSTTTSSRQIMLNVKKPEQRRRFRPVVRRTSGRKTPGKIVPGRKTPNRRTPGRRTPGKKTPGKKTPRKATPSASAKKRSVARRLIIADDDSSKSSGPSRETSKRALFVSPQQQKLSLPPAPINNRAMKSKRALFGSPSKDVSETSSDVSNDFLRKRKRDSSPSLDGYEAKRSHISLEPFSAAVITNKRKRTSDGGDGDEIDDLDIQRNKIPRSLSFSHNYNSSTIGESKTLSRRASENVLSASRGDLSETHKKKLLWAVAEALRSQNVGMSHPQFKSYAATLARLTRKLMPDLGKPNLSKQVGSTSDRMLRLARQHVFSVIKGKKIDEILIEEQIRQSRAASSKITGYVPLSEYEQSKISALSQRISKPPPGCHKVKPSTTSTFAHPGENSMSLFNSNSNSMFSDNYISDNEKGKMILQDKTINVDNSSSASQNLDNKNLVGKTKARRQISFDDFSDPKR